MARKNGPNQLSLEHSRRILLAAAIEEFIEHGYANSSTNRIVAKSGMARGSLYYHFGDKQGLFRQIYDDLSQDALKKISARMKLKENMWDAFIEGCLAYIECATDKTFRTIILMEAQNAIPYSERIELVRKSLLGSLMEIAKGLMDKGILPKQDLTALTFIIFGILTETGRSFSFASDIEKAHENAQKTLIWALNSFRKDLK